MSRRGPVCVRRHAIKAISFDLDDTLWPIGPVIVRAEQAMFRFLAEHYPRVTAAVDLEAMRAVRVRMALENPAMRHDFTFLRLAALRLHARDAGYPPAMAEEAFAVFFETRNRVDLYVDVRPALTRLTARFDLFTLSNGNADLAAVGIADFFRARIAARDAGALKPDARIFRRLVEVAGVAAHEILHVGDDPDADVGGARAAGMQAAWISRDGAPWPVDRPAPTLSVRTLQDLVQAVDA